MANYTLTGKLLEKARKKKNFPKSKLATMVGVEYRGLIDKLEDGSRKAPPEIALKLLKFLEIKTDDYINAMVSDYHSELRKELSAVKDIETSAKKIEESDTWKDLI